MITRTGRGQADSVQSSQYVSAKGNDQNDGSSWAAAKATVLGAYKSLPESGGVILLSPGKYGLGPTISISKPNVRIAGSGRYTTALEISAPTGDAFVISAKGFEASDLTIMPAKGVMRTAGAVLNVQAEQGYVHDVLLKDTYRGFVHNANASASFWHYRNIWQQTNSGISGALMIFGGGYPINDIEVDDVMSLGQGAIYNEPQLIVDNGMDTLKIVNWDAGYSRTTPQTQPCISIRNSVNAAHPARWIRFLNASIECTATAVGVQITNGENTNPQHIFWDQGYIASSLRGFDISGGFDIGIMNSTFVRNQQEGVRVSSSAPVDMDISHNHFDSNGSGASNTYDQISMAAGESQFQVTSNHFNAEFGGGKPRYAVTVNPGPSSQYVIQSNVCRHADMGTGCINDKGARAKAADDKGHREARGMK
jgi:hypothetical protein